MGDGLHVETNDLLREIKAALADAGVILPEGGTLHTTPTTTEIVVAAGDQAAGKPLAAVTTPYSWACFVASKPSGADGTAPGDNAGLIRLGFNTQNKRLAFVKISTGMIYVLPPYGDLNLVRAFADTADDGGAVIYLP